MNKEQRQAAKVEEVLSIILAINGMGKRSRNKTGTAPTAFFDFNGHVAGIVIRVYWEGWREYSDEFVSYEACTNKGVKPLNELIFALWRDMKKHGIELNGES